MLGDTFTMREYETTRPESKLEAARRERWEQAGDTWLGRRVTDLKNDDLSTRGLLFNLLNCTLSSVEVDWKHAMADYGEVPRTRELAAVATALDAALRTLEDM